MPTRKIGKRGKKTHGDIQNFSGRNKDAVSKVDGITLDTTPAAPLPEWVAVGNDGQVAYSYDAITWTSYKSPANTTKENYQVAYGDGTWVIAHGNPNLEVLYTSDPSQGASGWTQVNQGQFSGFERGIAYGNGVWISVGNDATTIQRSTDGAQTWTAINVWSGATNRHWDTVASDGNNNWILGDVHERKIYKSSDNGLTWSESYDTGTGTREYMRDAVYGGGMWIITDRTQKEAWRCSDLANDTWINIPNSAFNNGSFLYGVSYNGSLWMIGAQKGVIYTSTNGSSWTQKNNTAGSKGIVSIAWKGGVWVAVSATGIYTSSNDGASWTLRLSGKYLYVANAVELPLA